MVESDAVDGVAPLAAIISRHTSRIPAAHAAATQKNIVLITGYLQKTHIRRHKLTNPHTHTQTHTHTHKQTHTRLPDELSKRVVSIQGQRCTSLLAHFHSSLLNTHTHTHIPVGRSAGFAAHICLISFPNESLVSNGSVGRNPSTSKEKKKRLEIYYYRLIGKSSKTAFVFSLLRVSAQFRIFKVWGLQKQPS